MSSETDYSYLLDVYEKSKQALTETDDSLRRVYGREPFERRNTLPVRGQAVNFAEDKHRFRERTPESDDEYSSRKRTYTKSRSIVEDYESLEGDTPDEDEMPSKRPSLQSTVVAKQQKRSRKVAMDEQKGNSNVARNRRIFSSLVMGTLQKFQHEEKKRQQKESMREKIEKKVEAATEEEREKIRKEKENLIRKRREIKSQVRCYEKQLERAESHDVFQNCYKKILKSQCILTKSEPHIFFKLASSTATSKKCLEASNAGITALLNDKKASYEADLEEIKESYRKESETEKSDIKCLNEESESRDAPELESEAESLVVEQEEPMEAEEESTIDRRFGGSLEDQEFEPIYD